MEFVNKMRKEGKLIMGVGHRVKSVSNSIIKIFKCKKSFIKIKKK
jgi:ATP citrate (pro-S)-lyase